MITSQPSSRAALLRGMVAMAASLLCAHGFGATTTLSGTAGQTHDWNTAANWTDGVPSGETDAIIGEGSVVSVNTRQIPAYSGALILKKNATLQLPKPGSPKVVSGASAITMHAGSRIQLNMNANINFPPIKLLGDAAIECLFGASDKQTDNFGPITGPHTLSMVGFNRHKYNLNAANTFSKLVCDEIGNGYCEVRARAAGALGTGDVIVNSKATGAAHLFLDVADTIADNATLAVNGKGGVTIAADVTETVAALVVHGKSMPAGAYTRTEPWLSGDGTLKVAPILPKSPAPAFGAIIPSGDVTLTWKNLAPKAGRDVTVDVWFGTKPDAMQQVADGKVNLTTATVEAPIANTYFWRVDSYPAGHDGEVTTGTLFSFEVNDTDGDGFLDPYELAHTTPPSRTGLNPGDDIENGGAGDGLTNMEEFRLGTDPTKPDTDGDGLKDGPETRGAGNRPPTNPIHPDSDGDGLNDGVESNSGTFVGAADTGTNPVRPDTDGDGVDDKTEATALLAGAGDAPNPLKADAGPVKVFILLGQSNMVGAGTIGTATQPGSLTHAVQTEGKYPYLVGHDGAWGVFWSVRNVFVMSSGIAPMGVQHNEWMTIGTRSIGPEFGIAQHVRQAAPAPVLILKSCIGNRSLGYDLLTPGSDRYEVEEKGKTMIYAGYKDAGNWEKGTQPPAVKGWYAGVQYDGDIRNAKAALAELDTYYPGAKEYEIAGFLFWQGDKDRYNAMYAARYEQNLVRFIKQLRKDFNAPDAPFVCATLGQTRKGDANNANEKMILDAQLAVDGNSGKYPEFKGNVATVYSHPLSMGGSSNGHYSSDARTYMNVGEAMGQAMVELLGRVK